MEGRLAGFVAKTIEVIVRLAQSHRELQEMAQGIVKEERILCVCVLFSGQRCLFMRCSFNIIA